ncbi:MAG: MBG domain-containing protein [Limisphaerales bacterium]
MSGSVTTPVGSAGVLGSADGTGTSASFWMPQGLAVDASGNVFVADAGSGTIREVVGTTVSTLAGSASIGSADGSGAVARFFFPSGACIDDNGNSYVADTMNHTIRTITPAGVVSTVAGTVGVAGSANGSGTSAQFNSPQGIARDSSGNLYVADTGNHTIRKITSGGSVSLFAGSNGTSGWLDATGSSALFNFPQDVAVDSSGNVYVADTWNHLIRKITSGGAVTTFAGQGGVYGDSDGTGTAVGTNVARFNAPGGVTVDSSGNVYVADTRNHIVRQITSSGVVSTIAGLGGSYGSVDGSSNSARFFLPQAIAVDASGNLYVLDSGNQTIRKMTVSSGVWTVTTIAGNPTVAGTVDGVGSSARFFNPAGLGINSSGILAVADLGNNTIRAGVASPVSASVSLTGLSATYDGSAKATSATTSPSGLSVNFTYNGLSTVPVNAGSYTVVGTIGGSVYSGSATGTLVIGQASATVALGSLSATYDGTGKAATATTTPSGLAVTFTYNGLAAVPTNAGSYTVVGTINDPNYQGNATGTLVIGKATATVTLASLAQTYDGTGKTATATTIPAGLAVGFTYDNSVTAPVNAGSYTVVGTISDVNYQGTSTGTLIISKATATATLGSLAQTYDGSAKSATATTTPSGLGTTFTYNGLSTLPVNAGSYTVVGTIIDANYQGSATNILVISKATATVTLGDLAQTYDGSAKSVSATTAPTGLSVGSTYDGSSFAPTNVGSYTVIATINDVNYQGTSTDTLVVSKAVATVALGNLSQTYDGTAKSASANTTPSGLPVAFNYNNASDYNSSDAPTNAGSYFLTATVSDTNHDGLATNTFVIAQATATVSLGNLSQTYDGTSKTVTVTTTPAGLSVTVTYNGFTNAPFNSGSYAVVATVNDVNYAGSSSGTLIINPVVGCPNITVDPATLSTATLGVAYNQTITASGGVAPYTFVVGSGSLPDGLALTADGSLTGVPFSLQTNNFNIIATDTNGCSGVASYSIQVRGSGSALDTNKPILTIISPTNKITTNALAITVKGRALDSSGKVRTGVAATIYSVNGGAWTLATTTDHFTNWTANVTIQPGWNIFKAQALDHLGNASLVASNIYLSGSSSNVLGAYNGLFFETNSTGAPAINEQSAGAVLNVRVQLSGAYSGRIYLAGTNYVLRGVFDLSGTCTTNVLRGAKPPLSVNLQLDWTGATKQITGIIACAAEGWVAPLLADLATYNSKNPHTPVRYTIAIPPADDAPSNSPGGYGYGAVSINANGVIALSGAVADGSAISSSVAVSKDGRWPLYANLYKQQGLLEGWIDLSGGTPVGEVTWIKPATPLGVTLPTYLGGFTNVVNVFGSVYAPAVPAITPVNKLLEITDGSGLNLPLVLNADVTLSNAIVKVSPTTNALSGSIVKGSGLMSVSFRPTGAGAITKTAKGVVLQNSNAAYGAFVGNNDGTGKTNTGAFHLH